MKMRVVNNMRRIMIMVMAMSFFLHTAVYASAKTSVINELEKRSEPIDIILAIVLFVEVIAVGFEFIINRKMADKRGETIAGIPWIIGGTAVIAFSVQITKMIIGL